MSRYLGYVLVLLAVLSVSGAVAEPPEWTWDARLKMASIPGNIRPEQAERIAATVHDLGFNAALVGGFSDSYAYDEPATIQRLKTYTEACHRHGIKVLLKTMTLYANKNL